MFYNVNSKLLLQAPGLDHSEYDKLMLIVSPQAQRTVLTQDLYNTMLLLEYIFFCSH